MRYNRLRPQNKSKSQPAELSSSGNNNGKKRIENFNHKLTSSQSAYDQTLDGNGNQLESNKSATDSTSSIEDTGWRYDFDNSDSDYEDDNENSSHEQFSGDESSDFGELVACKFFNFGSRNYNPFHHSQKENK